MDFLVSVSVVGFLALLGSAVSFALVLALDLWIDARRESRLDTAELRRWRGTARFAAWSGMLAGTLCVLWVILVLSVASILG